MTTKIARGSFIILLGSFIFRIGGFLYRFAMANLLGPAGYGILGLTLPLQGIMIITSYGGLPPAIAKYVAHYKAKEDDDMVRQVIHTSLKVMILLGFFFSIFIYLLAEPLAVNIFHKPEAILPFQMIALITPFSVIVGAFSGVFQGFYQMTNILFTKAVEQIFMIIFAIILVLAGFFVAGAVVGTAIGFLAAAVAAYYLYRKHARNKFSSAQKSFTFQEELSIAKMMLIFAIPVVITGLAELALYDIGTFVIGIYMASEFVGYYNVASPIARLPLIMSMAVATAVLPATAEALSLENSSLFQTYIIQSYRYVTLVVLPLSVGIIVLAGPIINILFGSDYLAGTQALQILGMGMLFFTIYTVSASISQGMGKPYLPMTILVMGTFLDLGLSFLLVPTWGINGAAVATSIAALFIMGILAWKTLKVANVKLPFHDFGKIVLAALVMGIIICIIPQNILFLPIPLNYFFFVLFLLIAVIIYVGVLILTKALKISDINALYKLSSKFGPLKKHLDRVVHFLERFAS